MAAGPGSSSAGRPARCSFPRSWSTCAATGCRAARSRWARAWSTSADTAPTPNIRSSSICSSASRTSCTATGTDRSVATECGPSGPETQCIALSNIVGSRLLVANLEARAPLVGLFTGDLEYGRLPIDVAAFFDAGVAWSSTTSPLFAGGNRDLIRSVGGAIRINAFNLLIVEVAASHPLDRLAKGLQWQIGLRQGF